MWPLPMDFLLAALPSPVTRVSYGVSPRAYGVLRPVPPCHLSRIAFALRHVAAWRWSDDPRIVYGVSPIVHVPGTSSRKKGRHD